MFPAWEIRVNDYVKITPCGCRFDGWIGRVYQIIERKDKKFAAHIELATGERASIDLKYVERVK